jgi:hypothetical protein
MRHEAQRSPEKSFPPEKEVFFGDLGCTYLTMMAALLRKAVYSYFFFLVKRGNR